MRTWIRRLTMAAAGVFPAVTVVYFAGAAEAANCPAYYCSDRRLKKNIRPI